MHLGTIYLWERLWEGRDHETGPNNAKCVIWAIRKLFYYSFRVLLLLTTVFRYYFIREGLGKAMTTKRAQTRRLGR